MANSDHRRPPTDREAIYRKRGALAEASIDDKSIPECVYDDLSLSAMAKTLGVPVGDVERHREELDAAAQGYSSRSLWEIASAKKEISKIEGLCRKLLRAFGVTDVAASADGVGPAGAALIRAFAVVRDEDWLREQVGIIGEATRAAQELAVAAKEAQSYQAAPRTTDLGADAMVRLAVRGVFAGNGPDLVEDEFIVDVLEIYRKITGREPTVTNSPTNGTVSGTCLRFVQEAGRVIGVEVTGNRLHRIVNAKRKKAI